MLFLACVATARASAGTPVQQTADDFVAKPLAAADDTFTCTVCGHVYDAAADGGGVAFADLPDSLVCPICGAAKSAYVKSMLNGKVVWAHNDDHPEEKAIVVEQE